MLYVPEIRPHMQMYMRLNKDKYTVILSRVEAQAKTKAGTARNM